MNDIILRFPVTCPACGTEQLVLYPVEEIDRALGASGRLSLTAPCHAVTWEASDAEMAQIRDYRAAVAR